MVVDYEKDGPDRQRLGQAVAQRLPVLARRNSDGSIGFVDATNYVEQDVFASIDPKTEHPITGNHVPGTGKYAEFCPSLWGGKDWPCTKPTTRTPA